MLTRLPQSKLNVKMGCGGWAFTQAESIVEAVPSVVTGVGKEHVVQPE